MTDTKVLQSILDNVITIKNDIKALDKKLSNKIDKVDKRVDKLGKSLAYLEDDAPTREEHDNLDKRVTKIERKSIASV